MSENCFAEGPPQGPGPGSLRAHSSPCSCFRDPGPVRLSPRHLAFRTCSQPGAAELLGRACGGGQSSVAGGGRREGRPGLDSWGGFQRGPHGARLRDTPGKGLQGAGTLPPHQDSCLGLLLGRGGEGRALTLDTPRTQDEPLHSRPSPALRVQATPPCFQSVPSPHNPPPGPGPAWDTSLLSLLLSLSPRLSLRLCLCGGLCLPGLHCYLGN